MAGRKVFAVNAEGFAGLNLREQPSIESPIIRLMKNGEKVTIDPEGEAPEGWAAVKDGGYVMVEYLK